MYILGFLDFLRLVSLLLVVMAIIHGQIWFMVSALISFFILGAIIDGRPGGGREAWLLWEKEDWKKIKKPLLWIVGITIFLAIGFYQNSVKESSFVSLNQKQKNQVEPTPTFDDSQILKNYFKNEK